MIVYELRESKIGKNYIVKTVLIRSLPTLAAVSIPGRVVVNTKNMMKESLDFSTKFFYSLKKLCLCSKTYCCYDFLSNKLILSCEVLNKLTIKGSGEVTIADYRKLLDGTESVTSTNCRISTKNLCVAFHEHKKRIIFSVPKRRVQSERIQTLRLKVQILNVRGFRSIVCCLIYFSE